MMPAPFIITPGGETRILNLLPSSPHLVDAVPVSGLTLPESEIVAFDAWPAVIAIKDQDGRGACNGHATATALEFARYQSGQPHVPLSAWYAYGKLCMGRDRGSNILDALALVSSDGCAPETDVKYGDFSGRYSGEAEAAAKRFKLEIGVRLPSWDEVLARVVLRQSVNLSIRVGMRFNDLDGDGAPGVGYGPGNHAVMVGGGIKKSSKWGWMIRMANSWGKGWGQSGFCWLARAHIEAGSWFEAFTASAVVEDLSDTDNPPPALIA